jgi:hypothetical protein
MAKSGVSPVVYIAAAAGAIAVFGAVAFAFMQIDPPEGPASSARQVAAAAPAVGAAPISPGQ